MSFEGNDIKKPFKPATSVYSVTGNMEVGVVDPKLDLYLNPNFMSNALSTVGYSELFDYLDAKTNLSIAINMIKQNTRRFAKRQLTWFRKDQEIVWFEPEKSTKIRTFIDNMQTQNGLLYRNLSD